MSHYLKKELYELIKTDESIFDFIQESSLDGLWYWDLENPENEWMNPKFWTVLGYNPDDMPHKASAWQNIINQDDLQLAMNNFTKHCENPNHPYDQVVRYKHKNGSTIWIRCRGKVIRDKSGKPIRMLGSHHDISEMKRKEEKLINLNKELELNERKFKDKFDLHSAVMLLIEPETGKILDANKSAVKFYGYDLKTIRTIFIQDINQLDPNQIREERLKAKRLKRNYFTFLHKLSNGELRDVEVHSTPIIQDGKQILFSIIHDITDRFQAEKELIIAKEKAEESEARFKTLSNITFEGILIHDNGIIVDTNESLLKMFGYNREDVIGKNIFDLAIPKKFHHEIYGYFQSKIVAPYEIEAIKKDGTRFIIEIEAREELISDNMFRVAAIRDITNRKKAENELIDLTRRLKISSESAGIGIWDLNLQDNILIWDKRMFQLYGINEEEFGGAYETWKKGVHPEDIERSNAEVQDAIAGKKDFHTQFRVVWPDGQIRFIEAHAIVIRDPSGTPKHMIGVNWDITEKKKAEEALRKSEAIKNKMVSNIGDVIVIIDKNGINQYKSQNITKLFGWNPEELVGKSTWDNVHPDNLEEAQKFLGAIATKPNATGTIELQYKRKDGNYVWIEITVVNLIHDKDIQGILGNYHEITDRKKADLDLFEAKNKLSNQLKFANALNSIAESILNIDNEDELLNQANQIIGETLQLDRTLIYHVSFKENHIVGLCEWQKSKHKDIQATKDTYSLDLFKSPFTEILKTKKHLVSHFDNISEAFTKDGSGKMLHEHFKIKSLIWYPFAFRKDNYFVFTLNQILDKRIWTEPELDFVDSVAHQVNIALMKINFINEKEQNEANLKQTNNELQLAKQKVEKSETRLRNLFNSMEDVVFEMDYEGTYINIAPTSPDMLFGVAEDTTGKTLHDVFPKPQADTFLKFIQHCIDENKSDRITYPLQINGKNIWFEGRANPIGNNKVLYVASDITKRKLAENKLKESYRENQEILNNTKIQMWAFDGEYYSYLNKEWYNYTGQDKSLPLTVERWIDLVHPDDLEKAGKIWQKNLEAKTEHDNYFRLRREDGAYRHFFCHAIPVFNEDGSFKHFQGYNIDISETVEANKQISKLSTAVEQTANAIVITDNEGNIEYTNPQFTKTTGYTAKEVLGKNPRILNSGTQAKDYYAVMWKTIKAGDIWRGEFHNKKKNGELYWEAVTITPIIENNEIVNFLAIKQDITKQKQLEQELIFAKEKAEESNKLKTEFLNNMSHEIRTPMNGIIGFSGMLGEPNLSAEQRNYYTKIVQNSSNQLLRIIDDILDISVLETKQERLIEAEFSLNDLFMELFSIFSAKSKERNIPIYLNKALQNKESFIVSDKTKLHKILSNLLENALKFTNEGSIEFGYYIEKPNLILFVKDTGIGIAPENHEIIFDRFSQEEKDLSRKFDGLGLGLSISKENAALLGGGINLKSEKGKGSTFYVSIPYKPVQITSEHLSNNLSDYIVNSEEFTILVAEDEEVNYLYIEVLFENKIEGDYKLIHAKNGKEAVEFCMANMNIDLVLMDIKMPIMSGHEATEKIKEKFPNLPIIAQTAYSTESDKQLALKHGCDDFISKPLDKEKLLGLINKYLIAK